MGKIELLYSNPAKNLEIFELKEQNFKDFETLFGKNGACGGCWCMAWRLKKSDFEYGKGDLNKHAMEHLVKCKKTLGVLAYIKGEPVGWCAIAPREDYLRLAFSRIFKPIDDKPVWSISCLFIRKDFRRKGLSTYLIKGALSLAQINKAQIVEAYPTVPYSDQDPAPFLWMGIPTSFLEAGFVEVIRRSKNKPIMRIFIE